MDTKTLVKTLKSSHGMYVYLKPEEKEEVIQKLLEFDELKRIIHDAVDPLIELINYLLAISGTPGIADFQEGDINYGRK